MKSHRPKEVLLCNYIDSTTSLETIDSSRLSRDSILDSFAITLETVHQCPNLKEKYTICSKCDSAFRITMDCHQKDCAYCQKQRGYKLYKQYLPLVLNWKQTKEMRIQFLTVTVKNVSDISLPWLNTQDHNLLKLRDRLRKKGYITEFGFINKEMTYSQENGYHYHFHLLFYGPYINLKDPDFNLSVIWKDITGESFMVKLYSKFNNGSHALHYMMKYVCKAQETSPELRKYYDVARKKRNFQTFGKNYAGESYKKFVLRPQKLPFLCSSCGSEFKKNPYKRYSVFYDQLPNNYELKLVKILNRKRIKYIISILETKQQTKQEILSKIALNKQIFRQKNNWESVEALFTVAEIKYHLERGDIFETKEGYKLLE